MSIPIVLDKSTFQGLNYKDIIELHRYYTVNITPLLVSEILGDLSKEEKAGRKTPKEEVINLFEDIENFEYLHQQKMNLNLDLNALDLD